MSCNCKVITPVGENGLGLLTGTYVTKMFPDDDDDATIENAYAPNGAEVTIKATDDSVPVATVRHRLDSAMSRQGLTSPYILRAQEIRADGELVGWKYIDPRSNVVVVQYAKSSN